jgi:hyaluronan synthase
MPLDIWIFYVPLGIVGLARWVSWMLRRIPAIFYRPFRSSHRDQITVVTPVYQEDPRLFEEALISWLGNKCVAEVICVIHDSDVACKEVASRYPVRLIPNDDPRKRQAMRRGWELATTQLVALTDSDTVWATDLSERVCEPFADPTIGGVGTRQNVLRPTTLWHRLNDIYLDYRYFDEVAAQTALGRAVSCLSGRTAVYRREVLQRIAADFTTETFLGVPCLSGDDKALTALTLRQGWRTYLQRSARCWSALPSDAPTFFRQRLRWARNTWRSDLRALLSGWVYAHGFLAFCMADKLISPFTQLLSPTYFTLALIRGNWLFAIILIGWWLVSRGVKILPHLRRRPRDVLILPAFILLTFVMALVKIYALLTCRRQGWLTRELPAGFLAPEPVAESRPRRQPIPSLVRSGLRFGALGIMAVILLLAPVALPYGDASSLPERVSAAPGPAPENGYEGPHPFRCLERAGNPTECRNYQPSQADPFDPPGPSSQPLRGIRVAPRQLQLLAGGEVVRTVPFGASGWLSLAEIAAAIGDPAWIAETSAGVFELHAALQQERGTRLRVSAPDVRILRLSARPGVFIRGDGAIARFENVSVTSWVSGAGGPDLNTADGRPFMVYEHGSRLDTDNAVFSHLGSDHQNSHGVTWGADTTGSATRSTFRRNFFGVHTSFARNLSLRDCTFAENIFYGINVHTFTTRLVAAHNQVTRNGAHGIVLADGVSDSRIVDNHSFGNGGNGVLLFEDARANRIDHNRIERNLDGIAVIDSPGNIVEGNAITQHRTGIRVQGSTSTENILQDNVIDSGRNGIRVYGRPSYARLFGNTVRGMEGHGISSDAARTSLIGGEVQGTRVGLDLRAGGTIRGLRIDSRHGVFVRPEADVALGNVHIVARAWGLRVERPATVRLEGSLVMSPHPLVALPATHDGAILASSSQNRLIRRAKPAYGWLPYVGLVFVVAAAALELARRWPQRVRRQDG